MSSNPPLLQEAIQSDPPMPVPQPALWYGFTDSVDKTGRQIFQKGRILLKLLFEVVFDKRKSHSGLIAYHKHHV
jgi:hypothetical protein